MGRIQTAELTGLLFILTEMDATLSFLSLRRDKLNILIY